jgi:hypothetical protein
MRLSQCSSFTAGCRRSGHPRTSACPACVLKVTTCMHPPLACICRAALQALHCCPMPQPEAPVLQQWIAEAVRGRNLISRLGPNDMTALEPTFAASVCSRGMFPLHSQGRAVEALSGRLPGLPRLVRVAAVHACRACGTMFAVWQSALGGRLQGTPRSCTSILSHRRVHAKCPAHLNSLLHWIVLLSPSLLCQRRHD